MTMSMRMRAFVAATAVLALAACSDDSDPVGPGTTPTGAAVLSGSINANRTLSKDTTYTIRGFVYVNSGATLTTSILSSFFSGAMGIESVSTTFSIGASRNRLTASPQSTACVAASRSSAGVVGRSYP